MLQARIFLVLAPFALILAITCFLFALANRRSRQFSSLILFLGTTAAVILFSGLELKAKTIPLLLLYSHITYTIVAMLPVAWFLFCYEYTLGKPDWFNGKTGLLLLIIPAITSIFAWTNNLHHLLWVDSRIDSDGTFLLNRVYRYGFWFWIHVLYSYALYIAGTALVFRDFFAMERKRKNQCLLIVLAVSLPIACNLLYVFRLIPGIQHDFSALVFSVSGLSFIISISRFRLFETGPSEYRSLIRNHPKAIIIADENGLILSMSEVARELLGKGNHEYRHIDELIPIDMRTFREKADGNENQVTMTIEGDVVINFTVSTILLNDVGASGYAIYLHPAQSRDLLGTMSNREQAVYDLLAKGCSTKEIAAELCISENTAKTHIRHIYEKLHIGSRKELYRQTIPGIKETSAWTNVSAASESQYK